MAWLLLLLAFAGSATPATVHAFPPAPFHTLFGMVRDDNGQALRADGGEIVFYRNGSEFLRTPITETARFDQNYQIRLRMDMLRLGTQSYSGLANSTGASFTLGVVLNSIVYFPIEMSSSRTLGSPGERVRLDLTLGVDTDGDGIPDAWEQSQLYAGGVMPGDHGWDLSLINRDGDFDGDGVSNWQEYIAGTFAADPTDYLALSITEALPHHVRLRFFGIFNKVYSLESSTNLQTWTPASLFLRNPESTDSDDVANPPVAQPFVRARDTAFIDLYAPSDASGRTFYRLKVR
jgi:Bacterial TSP3 repeat